MKLLIISGLSGAGKSIALQALEDLDYYCVDNLPLALLPAFARQMFSRRKAKQDVAVGVDARNDADELQAFHSSLEQLQGLGVNYEIIFLEAADKSLLQRFSETRRKHPLTDASTSLPDAIMLERKLMEKIATAAALHIDTSATNVHQLRALIRGRVAHRPAAQMSMMFVSFGYKNGIPGDVDYVFDVRCLPNPHWDPRLRTQEGRDPAVIEFLEQQPEVLKMLADIENFLQSWVPAFAAENRSYLTIAIGCTGGQHRSVYLTERLAAAFRKVCENVQIRHRDVTS